MWWNIFLYTIHDPSNKEEGPKHFIEVKLVPQSKSHQVSTLHEHMITVIQHQPPTLSSAILQRGWSLATHRSLCVPFNTCSTSYSDSEQSSRVTTTLQN